MKLKICISAITKIPALISINLIWHAHRTRPSCGGACTLVILDTETAMDISSLSFYQNEKESLLAPGTQLKVIKRERKGKVTEVG